MGNKALPVLQCDRIRDGLFECPHQDRKILLYCTGNDCDYSSGRDQIRPSNFCGSQKGRLREAIQKAFQHHKRRTCGYVQGHYVRDEGVVDVMD